MMFRLQPEYHETDGEQRKRRAHRLEGRLGAGPKVRGVDPPRCAVCVAERSLNAHYSTTKFPHRSRQGTLSQRESKTGAGHEDARNREGERIGPAGG
jgi:hypothetical protein